MVSVGRIVHYTPDGASCWAAIVRSVDTGTWVNQETNETCLRETATLMIIPPMGETFDRCVSEGAAAGTWHWPERVE